MAKKRDYKKEYREYHGKPEKIKERSNRNKAVRALGRAGKSKGKGGDGKEVDHKDGNPRNNSRSNLQVISRRANRKKGG